VFHLPEDDFLPLVTGWVCCINSNDATTGGIQVSLEPENRIIVDKAVAGLEFPNQLHNLGSRGGQVFVENEVPWVSPSNTNNQVLCHPR